MSSLRTSSVLINVWKITSVAITQYMYFVCGKMKKFRSPHSYILNDSIQLHGQRKWVNQKWRHKNKEKKFSEDNENEEKKISTTINLEFVIFRFVIKKFEKTIAKTSLEYLKRCLSRNEHVVDNTQFFFSTNNNSSSTWKSNPTFILYSCVAIEI